MMQFCQYHVHILHFFNGSPQENDRLIFPFLLIEGPAFQSAAPFYVNSKPTVVFDYF
jgi:hypothetical protein